MEKVPRDLLDKYVTFCGDTYRMDKIIKAVGYAASFASCYSAGKSAREDKASKVLHDVYSNISNARCVFRLLGTTDAIQWYRDETDIGFIGSCNRVQALMMVLYHPLEHVSWLGYASSHMEWIDPDKWSRWSDWCWVVYLVADMVKVGVEMRALYRQRESLKNHIQHMMESSSYQVDEFYREKSDIGASARHDLSASDMNGGNRDCNPAALSSNRSSDQAAISTVVITPQDKHHGQNLSWANSGVNDELGEAQRRLKGLTNEIEYLQLQFVRDILYLPNALHWGCEKPLLSARAVASLGFAESMVGLFQTWKKSRV